MPAPTLMRMYISTNGVSRNRISHLPTSVDDGADESAVNAARPQERIWQVVANIPKGRVATYGQVAELAGLPRGARQVGRVLAALPAGSRLPWHRVVNAAGRVSLAGDAGRRQRRLLRDEGILLRADRIDLRRCRWTP